MTEDPAALIPLSPQAFAILIALSEGERHGYALMQAVDEQTGGAVAIGPGTLYGLLKRLLTQGLVRASTRVRDPATDDERRRYYALTARGRRVAALETARLERQLAAARRAGAAGRV